MLASIGIAVCGVCCFIGGAVSLSCANDGTPGQSRRANNAFEIVGFGLIIASFGLLVWSGYVLASA
jgi:hypothetical protein